LSEFAFDALQSSYYKTFVIEARHGFNKTSLGTWLADQVKSTVLSAVFLLPILAGVLEIIDRTGEAFVTYVCLFVLGLSFSAMLVCAQAAACGE
jgi:STE24 endopeptidase